MNSNTILFFSLVIIIYFPEMSMQQIENKPDTITSLLKPETNFFSKNGSNSGVQPNTISPPSENNITNVLNNISNSTEEIPFGIPVEKDYFEKLKKEATNK
jgi:hypothetical protein